MSQIPEDNVSDINDSEYHALIKRYVKGMKNTEQDIIDAAKRLED